RRSSKQWGQFENCSMFQVSTKTLRGTKVFLPFILSLGERGRLLRLLPEPEQSLSSRQPTVLALPDEEGWPEGELRVGEPAAASNETRGIQKRTRHSAKAFSTVHKCGGANSLFSIKRSIAPLPPRVGMRVTAHAPQLNAYSADFTVHSTDSTSSRKGGLINTNARRSICCSCKNRAAIAKC